MYRNQIVLTGIVQHDPRLSDSYPATLYTHIRLTLPQDAFPATPEMKRHVCVGDCKVVFQSNVAHAAVRFAKGDIIFVSGYLVTGYIRDSQITTNKIMVNYAVPVDKSSFTEADGCNRIEISGLLGDDPAETSRPVHAWSVPLAPHLSPELHPLHPEAKRQARRYQVVFSDLIADKAFQFIKNDLLLLSGHFIPSCTCHPRTSSNSIIANYMIRLGKSKL